MGKNGRKEHLAEEGHQWSSLLLVLISSDYPLASSLLFMSFVHHGMQFCVYY